MGGVRILGIVLTVIGAVILVIGLDATDSLVEEASHLVSGRYTQGTTAYLIVGLAALAAGAAMALAGRR